MSAEKGEMREMRKDLIDRNSLLEEINNYQYDTANAETRRTEHTVKAHICELIKKQPAVHEFSVKSENAHMKSDAATIKQSVNA